MKKKEKRKLKKLLKQEKHHYIPQFYLRPWLDTDDKLEEYGRVPPTNHIRSRRRGTKPTGFVYNLYTLPGTTEETKQNVERMFFGKVDADAAKVRDNMLAGAPLTLPERYDWARFILSLVLRNPEEVQKMKESVNSIFDQPDAELQAKYLERRQPHEPATAEEAIRQQFPDAPDRSALLIGTQLIQNQNAMKTIAGMSWSVIRTDRASRRLITSDRPVVMTGGLLRLDGHICLPISPRHLFVACTLKPTMEGFLKAPKSKLVRESNAQQIGQARLHVYGWDNSDLSEVRRGMSKRPYMSLIRTPDRAVEPA